MEEKRSVGKFSVSSDSVSRLHREVSVLVSRLRTSTYTNDGSDHERTGLEELKKESGCSGGEKPWLQSLDHYHGLKDEDPLLPVCEEPIVDQERLREPQPETELDLCARDQEDPEQDLQDQDSDLLLSPACPSPLLASQTKEPETDQKPELCT